MMTSSRQIIKSAFESMLYVWGDPIRAADAAAVFKMTEKEAVEVFLELADEYEKRDSGLRIRRMRNSFQFITAPENAEFIRTLCTPVKEKRLSQASLEVLAIIAYMQPVTKARMEQIRGIRCDRVLDSLIEKNLVRCTGRADAIGRPKLYGTTDQFLEYLGMESLSDLPEISEDTLVGREGEEKQLKINLSEEDRKSVEEKNIILVGMPASGKSTIGKALAEVSGKQFLDVDTVIEAQERRSLQEIIDVDGNDYFAEAEARALASVRVTGSVIATGGSAIFAEKEIERLRKTGWVVYLRIQESTVEARLDNLGDRGVTIEPGQTLADLYRIRTPYYERHADIIVDGDDRTAEETASEILAQIAENSTFAI